MKYRQVTEPQAYPQWYVEDSVAKYDFIRASSLVGCSGSGRMLRFFPGGKTAAGITRRKKLASSPPPSATARFVSFAIGSKNKAVFLDRDNTLIHDSGYLSALEEVRIIDGASEALHKLRKAGFLLIVVSNQSGIGRGYFTAEDAESVNRRMEKLFKDKGVVFDGIVYCPHRPEDNCECRKPKPGMLKDSASLFNIDLKSSVMIGDKLRDIEAGILAGCRLNFLISEEPGNLKKSQKKFQVVRNLREAVKKIIAK